jgi:hypothetical protein
LDVEKIMAGLIPIRRTVEEIDRANAELLRQHHEYLARWIAQRKPQGSASGNSLDSQSENLRSANSSYS